MSGPILVWFKRDLRVHDHPALAAAGAHILPVYIVEPEQWAQPEASGRQWAFTVECLHSLRDDLASLGQPLILRFGEAVTELGRLCSRHQITRMISHEETGTDWSFARDRRVVAWARSAGVEWIEVPQSGVVRRLRSRDGWQGLRDGFMRAPMVDPVALEPLGRDISSLVHLPDARALRLPPDACAHRQRGGRAAAEATLQSFLTTRGFGYRTHISSPLTAERACSRVSPHLALGVLAVRQVENARLAARAHQGNQWGPSLNSFAKRLAWRDHFIQKLEDAPDLDRVCLHPAHEALRPRATDATRLAAWVNGETGVPYIDACMRYLRATGWLNFRARAMLMSFASYHLWLDWRVTGQHLARMFTDYEPGIHWAQCQMQSGTTGINTIRIYNPVKQGHDHDPDGRFVRAWVPELAHVPLAHVHSPWAWPDMSRVANRYPAPIVDLARAAADARAILWGLRAQHGFSATAQNVAVKHGSRMRGSDRSSGALLRETRKARVPDPAQLSFDL